MPIDKTYLIAEIDSLKRQRESALVVVHEANGAIQAYTALLERLDQPPPDPDPQP